MILSHSSTGTHLLRASPTVLQFWFGNCCYLPTPKTIWQRKNKSISNSFANLTWQNPKLVDPAIFSPHLFPSWRGRACFYSAGNFRGIFFSPSSRRRFFLRCVAANCQGSECLVAAVSSLVAVPPIARLRSPPSRCRACSKS